MSNNLSGVVVGQYTHKSVIFLLEWCIYVFKKNYDCFRQKFRWYTGLKKLIKHFFFNKTNSDWWVFVFVFVFFLIFFFFLRGGNIRGNYWLNLAYVDLKVAWVEMFVYLYWETSYLNMHISLSVREIPILKKEHLFGDFPVVVYYFATKMSKIVEPKNYF